MTAAQSRAMENFWPIYGLSAAGRTLQLEQIFGRSAPCFLEIGFGNGDALIDAAAKRPDANFLGIEVHKPGVGHCLMSLRKAEIENVRLICDDAVTVMRESLPDSALAGINLFFPDPWPKKRHHKRRLVQPEFVGLAGRKLTPGGTFHIATDWENYAEHIDAVMRTSQFFTPLCDAANRTKTKFEKRGERLGHTIWERIYRRT